MSIPASASPHATAAADLAVPYAQGTQVLKADTFDLWGSRLIEASAGTGKTWTIASLVTRYVAEGHCRLDELLVVTFGRAASEELRLRVRELVETAALLPEAVTASAPRAWLSGVVGALRG